MLKKIIYQLERLVSIFGVSSPTDIENAKRRSVARRAEKAQADGVEMNGAVHDTALEHDAQERGRKI